MVVIIVVVAVVVLPKVVMVVVAEHGMIAVKIRIRRIVTAMHLI